MGTENSTIPSGAEGLKELVALAGQARGLEITTVKAPAGMLGVPAEIPAAIRHGTTPELSSVASLFEAYRYRPERKRGTAGALTLRSFIDIVNRHRTTASVVFANTDWKKPHFEAVIDYHERNDVAGEIDADTGEVKDEAIFAGLADNLKHRIRYEFPLSEEWQAWIEVNGEKLDQTTFAAFLEDHIAELASPTDAEKIALERDFQTTVATPAQVIALSRGLQVNVNSQVKNAITLQTGEGQILWEQTHTDGEGKPLKVPGIFLLSVSPFFMGDPVRIPVRLRYRAGGKIDWYLHLYRPDAHITERVREDLDTVGIATSLPTFEGSPEA